MIKDWWNIRYLDEAIRYVEVRSGKKEFGIRAIQADRIRYDLVHEWIQYCQEQHDSECQNLHGQPPVTGLRVIDCHTRSVVSAPPGCRYVALSYVWGDPPNPDPTSPTRFAPVVQDSITAALALGYEYLRVDKHCINQGDSGDKHEQVSQMNAIYAVADLTFIAASGNSEDDGLPGVGIKSRQPQEKIVVGDLTLTQGFCHLQPMLLKSKWATRAWTFQEGCLSRRSLFFTDQQVYFACNGMYCAESVDSR
ncbi:heterokaryon incompatibility protein-domain-containing protein [Apiosordaria backusii]|uniref:Heterokaryon incompatibility protein-domain-containing protein n=1 Tax=Apiosordaria backusii TaxID=314023 RepID=A0AA40K0R7_9PEZI|nr:heterokaryon incompatibility protein-domain-containing protein [Apiosordaria backusii]